MEIRSLALAAWLCPDAVQKVALAQQIHAQAATLSVAHAALPDDLYPNGAHVTHGNHLTHGRRALPGCPPQPLLVQHLNVPKRSPYTTDGLAALVHAVCHIEFNAVNLALDAVWRYADMPQAYYTDWARIAAEEALHFSLLSKQLHSMGYHYGHYPAHTGLWDMAEKTAGNITARMALVPRTLEARGLDATPPMQAKLRKVGSRDAMNTVAILDTILHDEVGHVAIGNQWYRWLCARDGLEPVAHFKQLLVQYQAPRAKPPFNEAARRMAGFTDAEMAALLEV